jgi:glycosyltransferase involved in cell wall biosynthesis
VDEKLDRDDGQQALIHLRQDARYRWQDDCDRAEALAWMKNSVATINSSFSEGGANTVLEAIQLGVPVIASDIPGNRGFLGENYAGYFESDNSAALASLMGRCLNEPNFLKKLRHQIVDRRPTFTERNELAAFAKLLAQ